MIPYLEFYMVVVAFAFCTLWLYSSGRLMCHCSIYGCQTGIVSLLIVFYLLALCIHCLMTWMIVFYHIDIHSALHQHQSIPFYTYLCGLYGILWLDCVLSCLMIAGWCMAFSDLFGMAPSTAKKCTHAALLLSVLYFIVIIAVYVLFEITNTFTFALYLSILSYIDLVPMLVNIVIGFVCLCKLPLSQPIDLSIGLYQRNTVCSCYTTITQYIWLMITIPICQSILVILIVLEIDVWDLTDTSSTTMPYNIIITDDIAKSIYFVSQFVSLLLVWKFVGISIRESSRKRIVLDVLSGNTHGIDPINEENKEETLTRLHSHVYVHGTSEMEEIQHTQDIPEIKQAQQNEQMEEREPVHTQAHVQIQSNSVESGVLPTDEYNDLASFNIFTVRDIDPEHNFQIIEPLGEGAYGPVFAAVDARDDQMVALKVMSFNPDDCKDLLSEIDILQRCHSPYIVNFKDTFHKDTFIFLAIEYCDGGSILDVMKITGQHLTELQCQCVVYQALCGLIYLHSINLIHRDIKAANILVNSSGCCKLADFGVAKAMRASGVGTTIGSPYWMAPEVISSNHYDTSADIWSLGITAIEMAIGKPPLAHFKPMQAMLTIPKNPAPAITPDVAAQLNLSMEFAAFIGKCLKKTPQQRGSAAALIEDEWIQRVEANNMSQTELIPLMDTAIPLLKEERKLSAFMANQEENKAAEEDQEEEDEDDAVIHHQPTGTFMVMPVDDTIANAVDLYGDDQEDVNENEEEDGSMEGTEIRHCTESSSGNDNENESESESNSRVIMEF
eukprot:536072_1